jgi:hypothetical protein
MVMVGWALEGAEAMITFADSSLGALQSMIPALAKVGSAMYYAAAAAAYMAGQGAEGVKLFAQGKAMEAWAMGTQESLGKARTALQGWGAEVKNAKTKVELTANIEDLDQKLAKAQAELRDPGLTKERRAVLTATIAQLTRAKDEAIRKLGDKNLIKTRTAKLEADKRSLDAKIAAAKKALGSKDITRERAAKLNADIRALLKQKAVAQSAIDSLHGKTVVSNMVVQWTQKGVAVNVPSGVGRAAGGPVTKGQPYVVGEKRPELFVPDENGTIVPDISGGNPAGISAALGGYGQAVTMPAVLNLPDTETGRFILRMLRKAIGDSGNGGNVQLALAGRLV